MVVTICTFLQEVIINMHTKYGPIITENNFQLMVHNKIEMGLCRLNFIFWIRFPVFGMQVDIDLLNKSANGHRPIGPLLGVLKPL